MKKYIWVLAAAPMLWAEAQVQDFVEYANCAQEDYIVVDTAEISIGFQGSSYEPQCIKVKPGTSIQIAASSRHPLQAAEDFNNVTNPFRGETEHLQNQTRTLTELGFYGYYCTRHADPTDGSGMGGMIWVTNE